MASRPVRRRPPATESRLGGATGATLPAVDPPPPRRGAALHAGGDPGLRPAGGVDWPCGARDGSCQRYWGGNWGGNWGGYWGGYWGQRTVITGQGACRTTFSAMLPSSMCWSPLRPCVPITTRSYDPSVAKRKIVA